MITDTKEYQDALSEFKKVDDRPICLFISSKGASLKERIQVLDLDVGQNKEESQEGNIILVKFNRSIKVRKSR